VREMWRVLAPGGRLAVAVWAAIDRAPGFRILADIAARLSSPKAAELLAAPFVLGDRAELADLFAGSGIPDAGIDLREGSIRFSSIQEFIRVEVKGSPLAGLIGDAEMPALVAEAESALAQFVVPSGEVVMPIAAHIVTAGR
jgi:SAM-dependent methyltransferase